MKVKSLTMFAMAAMTLAAISCKSGNAGSGTALEGNLGIDGVEDFVMIYNEEGDLTRSHSIEITVDDKGQFQVPDSVIPLEGTHVQILADDKGYYGAWLERGKKAVMEIKLNADGKAMATFSGDNADINNFYNDVISTYDIMVFSPQDPSERKPYEESLAYLEECKARLAKSLDSIKDKEKREYYGRYSTLLAARTMGFLIEDRCESEDAEAYDDPEYQRLISLVDPNDEAALETGMIYLWLNNKARNIDGTEVQKAMARLKAVDKEVKNPRIRKALYNMVPHSFFAYGKPTPQEAAEFMKGYGELAKDYPELIDNYALMAQSVKEIKEGDSLNYDPEIMDESGKKCKLSDLFGEDIIYIDFWATWCGPCCKQIPHLEKMVENMKDVKGVKFVSISSDSDIEAWKKKLAKDKPNWPQYIFSGSDGDSFMTAMNITGIPRFMIIAKDGSIISPDASMPSDPKTEQELRKLVK